MKKYPIFLIFAFLAFSLVAKPAYADNGSSTVQKALDSTKQFLDDLVTSKDENSGDDISLRVQTFSKIIDLSQAEAKDFEFKLIAVDKDEKLDVWKKSALKSFDQAISFFDSQKDLIGDGKSLDLAGIKKIAQDFKSCRDSNYLPLVNQAQNFLLIKQEVKGIQTAQSRFQKITSDLKLLKQSAIANSSDIKKSLDNSKKSIDQSVDLNNQAASLFIKNYIKAAGPSSTSTEPASTSTDVSEVPAVLNLATSTATTTAIADSISTSTATSSLADVSAPVPIVSIKDLVKSSLNKIKDAYQGFIDISNLVRKLLK